MPDQKKGGTYQERYERLIGRHAHQKRTPAPPKAKPPKPKNGLSALYRLGQSIKKTLGMEETRKATAKAAGR